MPSPGDLPDQRIKLGSPALQADSLPVELPGEPKIYHSKCFLFFLKSESRSVCLTVCHPMTIQSVEFSRILEWIALPFSRGFSQPRDQTQLSLPHFREILYQLSHKGIPKYRSGYPIPSPVDLPDPGLNYGFLHCTWILYEVSYQGSP